MSDKSPAEDRAAVRCQQGNFRRPSAELYKQGRIVIHPDRIEAPLMRVMG